VSFTSSQPERRSAWGAETGDRTMALNGFQYTALDPSVALEWVRKAAVSEVWKVSSDVAWPAAGVNLWSYLAGDAWDDLPGATRPFEGGDTDSLALPATDRILLVQMEPRDPDAAADAGEVQRLAVWYDRPARAWKAWLWTVPRVGGAAVTVLRAHPSEAPPRARLDSAPDANAVVVEDLNGRALITEAQSVTTDGGTTSYSHAVQQSSGRWALDDGTTPGAARCYAGVRRPLLSTARRVALRAERPLIY
jgi:hypothetical protein